MPRKIFAWHFAVYGRENRNIFIWYFAKAYGIMGALDETGAKAAAFTNMKYRKAGTIQCRYCIRVPEEKGSL